MGKIIAVGGGRYDDGEIKNILEYIASCAKKENPAVLFLPTAGFDDIEGDEHIRDMILFVLGDLAEENHIHCDCPDGEGDFLVDQTRDSVRISCKKCGCFKEISCAGTSIDSQALFDCTHLYLQKEEN